MSMDDVGDPAGHRDRRGDAAAGSAGGTGMTRTIDLRGVTLRRVTVRSYVETACPHGGIDRNDVEVTWRPEPDREVVHAETVHEVVHRHAGVTMFCEGLALVLAANLKAPVGYPVTVVVRQQGSHRVEAEATSG